LKEISNRLSLSIGQVRMMTAKELSYALLENKININVLNQRINYLIYFIQNNKEVCLSGEKALKYIQHNTKKEKKVKIVNELMGNCAYAGKVRGLIKIINTPADMQKMNNGDILLACTTNPNLMPAIRKAKAIITDEGGLTCHAAIVSREMRIPCVIGTKIATQVLKDGDLVEVDANNGIVNKLNKKGG
jgi:pyruvate,water dikinase